jgi:hypothetical protein
MPNLITRYRVERETTGQGPISCLALRGEQLAVVAGDELRIIALSGAGAAHARGEYQLGWTPGRVALSPSNGYALLRDIRESRLVVYDLTRGAAVAEFNRSDAKPYPLPGVITAVGAEEVLLVSPRVYELEAYRLRDMTRAFAATSRDLSPFVFTHLYALNRDADTFFALGFHLDDMPDTLATFSLRELSGGASLADELRQRRRINDRAYRIAVGPCGSERAVFFRDPQGDETPSDEDEDEGEEGPGDVWNFSGLYVRRVSDGGLVERFEYDAPVKTGAPIFATGQAVVVAFPDRVELVPRPGVAGEVSALPCRNSSLDPDRRRVALLDEGGAVEIIEVP